jgi:hypothetical protein
MEKGPPGMQELLQGSLGTKGYISHSRSGWGGWVGGRGRLGRRGLIAKNQVCAMILQVRNVHSKKVTAPVGVELCQALGTVRAEAVSRG